MENTNQDQAVLAFDKVLADALAIQDECNFIPDCSTEEGYEKSKRLVLDKTTKARSLLQSAHKDAKAYWLAGGKAVDSKKNDLLAILLAAEEPHKLAYKAVDAEKKRIKEEAEQAVQNRFNDLERLVSVAIDPDTNSESIEKMIEDCQELDVDSKFFGKRISDYIDKQKETLDKLSSYLIQKAKFEQMEVERLEMEEKQAEMDRKQAEFDAHQAEMDRLKTEEEARVQAEIQAKQLEVERVEREKQHKIQLEEQKKKSELLAEQQRLEALEQQRIHEERAEQQRLDDIEKARLNEIERQRQEQERIKQEEEKRAADLEYTKGVNNKILNALTEFGIKEETAKTFIKLAAKGMLPQLTINY